MKRWQKVAVCGAIAAVAAGSGAAAAAGAATGASPHAQIAQPANPHPAAVPAAEIDTTQESEYTPIAPCRIVDTRSAGGPIASGGTRSFYAVGTFGFAPQGGKSGGCGVPYAASAEQVTITAVGATGNGFLKAYPSGSALPGATFLNFTGAFNVSGAGSVTICGECKGQQLSVSVFGHQANVVIDVQGYYIPPMWAKVNADGSLPLARHSRTTGSQLRAIGEYQVDFDRDVSGCAYNVTSNSDGFSYRVGPLPAVAHSVFVGIVNTAGTPVNASFYLTVTC